jgi:manganese/zinc/iron transport system substrate-binding protein
MKKFYLLLFIILSASVIYFLSIKENSTKIPLIVCSTSIIYDTVINLISNGAEVISIMGPGIDPHLYKASSGDAYNIDRADIIFYNGLHLEGKMTDIFESIKKKNKNIYAVSDAIPEYLLLATEYENLYDPHIWHDVILWKKVTKYIANILIEKYPEKKSLIEKNKDSYLEQLDELDFFVKNKLSEIKYSKILITSHDAFSYFAKRYGIQCYSVQGISTDAEASINDTERILKILNENDIPTIFVEQTVCQNYLKNIQSIMELQGKKINIGVKLYSDALGEQGGNTYIKMIKDNVTEITAGLNNYESQ